MSSMEGTSKNILLDKWGRFRRNDGDSIMASRKDTILKAAQRTAKQAHSAATQRRKRPSSRVNVDPHRHCSVCWKPILLESDPRSVEMMTALGCMKGGEVEEAFLFHHVSRYCCFRRNAGSSDIHGGIRLKVEIRSEIAMMVRILSAANVVWIIVRLDCGSESVWIPSSDYK